MSAAGWMFRSAGRIAFGAGTAGRTGELMQRHGWRRALLVTDPNLHAAAQVVADSIRAAGIELRVFDGGQPEPAVAVVEELVSSGMGAGADVVVGLGGGSNIDVAKAGALLLRHGGAIEQYVGQSKLPGPALPVVALPTTAGSGSEVSGACILSVPSDDTKLAVVDDQLRPALAIIDPELHRSCPASVTRDAGVDAFCHAVEALTIVDWTAFPHDDGDAWPLYQGKHPFTDTLAERAIALVAHNLPRVLEAPGDLAAREAMAHGALLAGMAMSNTGLYTVHALTYPVGAFTHASHGACNGVLLPAVLDFIAPVRAAESRRIVELMGSSRAAAGDAVRDWLAAIGAPRSLADLGLAAAQIQPTAAIGFGIRRLMNGSPRATSPEQLLEIVRCAHRGSA